MSNAYTEKELKKYFKEMLDQLAPIVGHKVATRVVQLQKKKQPQNQWRMIDEFRNCSGMRWLYSAFVWNESPEGDVYWYTVAHDCREP